MIAPPSRWESNRLTLRKRQLHQAGADALGPSFRGKIYDSGRFFQACVQQGDRDLRHANFARTQKESRKCAESSGVYRHRLLSESHAPPKSNSPVCVPKPRLGPPDPGTLDYGQGQADAIAQVLCAPVGVPFREASNNSRSGRQRSRAQRQRHRRLALITTARRETS